MDAQEIAPGLWRWTGRHPDWTPSQGGSQGWDEEVASYFYEAPDAVILFDPLVPPDDPDGFWRALERDVARTEHPLHVLITIYWHTRSAGEIVRRLDARLWEHTRARGAIERRASPARGSERFRTGDPLPGEVEAIAVPGGSELVYWIPAHRALVTGDVILGRAGGGIRLSPESWGGRAGHERLRAGLRPLLDLPVERVLVTHGAPLLKNGHAALERLLRST